MKKTSNHKREVLLYVYLTVKHMKQNCLSLSAKFNECYRNRIIHNEPYPKTYLLLIVLFWSSFFSFTECRQLDFADFQSKSQLTPCGKKLLLSIHFWLLWLYHFATEQSWYHFDNRSTIKSLSLLLGVRIWVVDSWSGKPSYEDVTLWRELVTINWKQ